MTGGGAVQEVTPQVFAAGDLELDGGGVLPDVRLSYATHGELSPRRDNAVLFPTAFAGSHAENAWLIGPGRPLDPRRHFVIVPNQLGGGWSSSPSTHAPGDGDAFPAVTIADNVRLQARLLDRLGVERLQLAVGYSMGGQQAYQWAVAHPERVRRLACICSAARTSTWQRVFLDGLRSVLAHAGQAGDAATARGALTTLGRVWAGWGTSAAFYDRARYRALGFDSAAAYVERYWVARLTALDPRDVAAMLDAWYHHDVAAGGDLAGALARVRCPVTLVVSASDRYFRPEYAAEEQRLLPRARLVVLASDWGHAAGRGFDPDDARVIAAAVDELLAREAA